MKSTKLISYNNTHCISSTPRADTSLRITIICLSVTITLDTGSIYISCEAFGALFTRCSSVLFGALALFNSIRSFYSSFTRCRHEDGGYGAFVLFSKCMACSDVNCFWFCDRLKKLSPGHGGSIHVYPNILEIKERRINHVNQIVA